MKPEDPLPLSSSSPSAFLFFFSPPRRHHRQNKVRVLSFPSTPFLSHGSPSPQPRNHPVYARGLAPSSRREERRAKKGPTPFSPSLVLLLFLAPVISQRLELSQQLFFHPLPFPFLTLLSLSISLHRPNSPILISIMTRNGCRRECSSLSVAGVPVVYLSGARAARHFTPAKCARGRNGGRFQPVFLRTCSSPHEFLGNAHV